MKLALAHEGLELQQVTAPPARDTAERLQELQRLFDKGLITREEYEQKRAAILQGL